MRTWIGIDIGMKGAIVGIDENKNIVRAEGMPTYKVGTKVKLDILAVNGLAAGMYTDVIVCVEEPGSHMPSAAATASCNFAFGVWVATLTWHSVPHTCFRARTWQAEFGIASTKGPTKSQALHIAKTLFPDLPKTIQNHDGMVDALLIAEYARRKNL